MNKNTTLRMQNISKTFSGEKALKNVTFEAKSGTITALLGINGAGKSTLMNILGGILQPDSGSKIYIKGKEVKFSSPVDAEKADISFIKQEPVFFYEMTVAENVFIGNLFKQKRLPFIVDKKKTCEETSRFLKIMDVPIDPQKKIKDISIGERQIIEIVRALTQGSNIIIFDEPTSSLSSHEKEKLFSTIRNLKEQGSTIIYITHFLEEVMEICDEYFVLRDGAACGSGKVSDVTQKELSELIIGRKLEETQRKKTVTINDPILQVSNFNRQNILKDIKFTLNRGEILGIWGLMRSGRTELLRALVGLDPVDSGEIKYSLDGKLEKISSKKLLKKCGYVTENRHSDGLILPFPVWKNITLPTLKKFSSNVFSFMNTREERKTSDELISSLKIATPNSNKVVNQLSGGNQQKVILAKWINKNPEIIFLDEPTRGVDVGAKFDIYKIIKELVTNGTSVVLVSSEIEEMVDLCDRVLALRNGKIIAEVKGEEIGKNRLMELSV